MGVGSLPQPSPRRWPVRDLRHVMILAVTGLERERRMLAGPGVEVVAGGGDHVRLEAALDQIAGGMDGVISIGIAGGLEPGLAPGRWVVANAVRDANEAVPTDSDWTGWLVRRLPRVAQGVLLGADALVATAAQKGG